MSLNQPRFDKNESQFRKPGGGRSGNSGSRRRNFRGTRGRGGGGGPNPTIAPPVSTNRSYKKVNNAQGGQTRGNAGPVNASDLNAVTGSRSVANGGHVQSTLHGGFISVRGVSNTPTPAVIPKPADASSQKTGRPLAKAPSSQSSSMNSDSSLPSTQAKGDGGKGFSLQFGSISPGFMNGMQVPARTSSAPPNLDEQNRDQAQRDPARVVPAIPLPSAPKQDLPSYGVLRNPRAQGPVPHVGGILSGPPMHSMGFQGMQRNNSDADRWQRATNFNEGLTPDPQGPTQVMHKAEKKYEIGKISDEEEAKQRRLKGILNKLTPQNFEKLFEQVKEINIDNSVTLSGVVAQIFDKALTEPIFCEIYANFCQHLASELPELSVDNETITFRRLLLNKCQEEFERGEREEQEANKADNDGEDENKESEGVREEKRLKARQRMLGNIRFIGELYKKRMLTERIMHECIKKLLGQDQNPDEENIEALCKLMSTIGEMIDHPKAKEHMDAYFDIMGQLSNNMKLSSRVRFMLRDAIDLRKNKWQQRRKVEGPKKIEEVHRDAAQERQGQAGRSSRGPSMNPAMRRGAPVDFGPRGAMLSSPIGQGGFRGMPSQARGFVGQDVRIDERNIYESRPLSMPLPQRLSSDEPITLGPQGGLAKGMAYRGQTSMSNSPLLESTPGYADSRRFIGGLNGYNNMQERGVYSSREDHFLRNPSDRFGAPVSYDQSSSHEFNPNRDARYPDRNVDRARPITPPVARAATGQSVSSEKVLSEERLRDKSIAAIREYYSAKDEKEVALCIRDLNAPSFYPTVVSIWVTDSFERKDLERDLLSKLLVNLTRLQEGIFSPGQLAEGFQSVLTDLEDTVTDAPKAPEFLGRMFARVVLDNVISLKDVGRLIHDGGEEPGRLREVGLAADILGSVLEMIKSEGGESVLNEVRAASNLRLEDFRPPGSTRPRKLEMFM